MKNVVFDTEFYCYGDVIELISIGCICCETGEEFYAESADFTLDHFDHSDTADFLRRNVMPKLAPELAQEPTQIRQDLLLWIHQIGGPTRWWAWFGAYDFVLLCKLFGGYHHLPLNISNRYRELAELSTKGVPRLEEKDAHHALTDARWNLTVWKANFE